MKDVVLRFSLVDKASNRYGKKESIVTANIAIGNNIKTGNYKKARIHRY